MNFPFKRMGKTGCKYTKVFFFDKCYEKKYFYKSIWIKT